MLKFTADTRAAVATGNVSEFESTALIHMDELYAKGLRLTKNERDAEDLVQETFLRAFRSFHRYEKNTNCRAWLFKIQTNAFINNYRRRVKERQILGKDNLAATDHNLFGRERTRTSIDPERSLVCRTFSADIRAALESLPLDFRAAVVLADLQQFSYMEIAYILGCPVGTVMSRVFRGRKAMRNRLAAHAHAEGIIKDMSPYAEDSTNRTRLAGARAA